MKYFSLNSGNVFLLNDMNMNERKKNISLKIFKQAQLRRKSSGTDKKGLLNCTKAVWFLILLVYS